MLYVRNSRGKAADGRQEVLSDKEANELDLLDTDVIELNGEDGYIKSEYIYWTYGRDVPNDYRAVSGDKYEPGRGFYGPDLYYYYI